MAKWQSPPVARMPITGAPSPSLPSLLQLALVCRPFSQFNCRTRPSSELVLHFHWLTKYLNLFVFCIFVFLYLNCCDQWASAAFPLIDETVHCKLSQSQMHMHMHWCAMSLRYLAGWSSPYESNSRYHPVVRLTTPTLIMSTWWFSQFARVRGNRLLDCR